ncbi:hypothetical protein RN001_000343 [Aquatica leii]|uniref:Flavin-containing monooxygenase n=1 Tax=Aquatica leii TaxID=1421715 RepID=A0AAN7SJ46_9COLE|nr:hypothetical protein RN001_000343 [Aquatica leii]
MKIAIIGAGVAGILSLKYLVETGIECDCFEETESFGGTWVYTPETGTDKNGYPIYRSMYQNLITNIPKELMTLSNFPYPEHVKNSYIKSSGVLQYLSDYVRNFNLEQHIQYYTTVTKVHSENNDTWMVTTLNLTTKTTKSQIYNYVFVCSGHFRFSRIPSISGQNLYQGLQMHSRDYRAPDFYKNKRVLLIGGGFSGKDIANQIVNIAHTVFLSHRSTINISIQNVIKKPSVVKFQTNTAIFSDGYDYKFSFLTDSCGISNNDDWVRPLYKHIVNIQHPTMIFIGIPYLVTPFVVNEFQVQFAVAMIKKSFTLPSQQTMLAELEAYVASLKSKNQTKTSVHKFGFYQKEYLLDLAKTANLKPLPPVLNDLYDIVLSGIGITEKTSRFIILNNYDFIEEKL